MFRWRKSWTLENLEGSIRRDLEPSERSVWSDLLDLCGLSRRWGIIERSEGIPYTDDELAQRFITPVNVVTSTIRKCVNEGRLQYDDNGALVVTHWTKYQAKKAKKELEKSDIPLAPEDRESSQKASAARLGYLQPEAAKRGAKAREFEDEIKGKKKPKIKDQGTKIER